MACHPRVRPAVPVNSYGDDDHESMIISEATLHVVTFKV